MAAAATMEFKSAFHNTLVRVGDVYLYSGFYWEIYQISEVHLNNSGKLHVIGRGRRIRSPFEINEGSVLLNPAF